MSDSISDQPLDYERIRATVEKRLEPQRRLRQHWLWLILNFILWFILNLVLYSLQSPLLGFAKDILATTYDETGKVLSSQVLGTMWQAYPLTIAFTALWFFILVVMGINLFAAGRHERRVQQAITHEVELEKMRLQLELERLRQSTGDVEKAKRTLKLSDDGELVYDDDHQGTLSQTASTRK